MNNLVTKAYIEMKKSQTNDVTLSPTEEVKEEIYKIQARSKELKDAGMFDKDPIILTGKEQKSQLRLFATDIMCDMLTNLLNLKNGVDANNSSLNYDLEIHQGGNLIMADKLINSNISLLRDSIENALKYVIQQQDLQILTKLENTTARDMLPICERLYSYYITESTSSHSNNDPLDLMNKCIKMLLEAQVKGVYKKENISNV